MESWHAFAACRLSSAGHVAPPREPAVLFKGGPWSPLHGQEQAQISYCSHMGSISATMLLKISEEGRKLREERGNDRKCLLSPCE